MRLAARIAIEATCVLSEDRTNVRIMSWDGVVDDEAAMAAMDGLDAALDAVAALRFDTMTNLQRLAVLNRHEASARRMAAIDHQLIARLSAEASPVELGAKSMTEVLVARLRISRDDAQRRLGEAADLGPRTALTGEPLQPALAKVAAAQAAGLIGQDHVEIIRKFFAKLPGWVDPTTREQAEDNLVRVAEGFNPDALRKAAAKLMAYLDQDGPMPNDAERARRRHITIGRQAPDGMSKISGLLDPQARATWEAWTAKLAAPGMCNPDDDTPCTSGAPSQAQIEGDQRTPGQRNHDALTAMGRSVLSSGELGQHNGLPVTVIVSTTAQDLESAAGVAVTGGGSLLPMPDLIRMASHAHHYLAVFDKHTGESLYLGRTRRCASPAQRIVLHARDRGCTKPGSAPRRATGARCITSTVGQPTVKPTSTTSPWLADPTTGPSNKAAGPPAGAKTASSNGSRHRAWTPAKPGRTSITIRNGCSSTPPRTTRSRPQTKARNPTPKATRLSAVPD